MPGSTGELALEFETDREHYNLKRCYLSVLATGDILKHDKTPGM